MGNIHPSNSQLCGSNRSGHSKQCLTQGQSNVSVEDVDLVAA